MAWKIEFSEPAERVLEKLDPYLSQRILKFLRDRIAKLENPRSVGKPLQGPHFGELWRYRVGDFRIICRLRDDVFVILVIEIGQRKKINARAPGFPDFRREI
jgi:mRNA interferase RelE/StbE